MRKLKRVLYNRILILNLITFGLAYFKDFLVAYKFGAGAEADIYFLVISITTMIYFISGADSTKSALIPFLSSEKNLEYKDQLLKVSIIYLTTIVAVIIVISPLLSGLFEEVSELNKSEFLISLRIATLSVTFMGISVFLESLIYLKKKYIYPAISPLIFNSVMVILTLCFWSNLTVVLLCFFYSIGNLARLLYTFYIIRKQEVKFDLKSLSVKKGNYLADYYFSLLPIIGGSIAVKINSFIDVFMASGLPSGSIAALNFANRIYQLPIALLTFSYINIRFAQFSLLHNENGYKYQFLVKKTIKEIILIGFPIFLIMYFFSYQLVELLFGRGAFDEREIKETALILKYYSIGLPFNLVNLILMKMYHSQRKNKFPLIVSVFSVVVNIIMNKLFISTMGASGLALATSLVIIINCLLLLLGLIFIKRKEKLN